MISEDTLRLQWALSYPFNRPETSFLFVDGQTFLFADTSAERFADWRVHYKGQAARLADLVGEARAALFDDGTYHPVVAVGSNAAPIQLRRKYDAHLEDVVIPVLRVTVTDHVIAYANRIAAYGSVPATIAREPGAKVHAYATLLSPRDYEIMNRTEDLGTVYDTASVEIEDAPPAVTRPFEAYQCLSGHMPLTVRGFEAENAPYPAAGQWEAQDMAIRALGLSHAVDAFARENVTDPDLVKTRDLALAARREFG